MCLEQESLRLKVSDVLNNTCGKIEECKITFEDIELYCEGELIGYCQGQTKERHSNINIEPLITSNYDFEVIEN